MNIFTLIAKSIYGPDLYLSLADKKLGFSIKYFFKFILLFSLLVALVAGFVYVPKLNNFINTFGARAVEYYPQELEIVIKEGKASTNVEEPYFLTLPEGWSDYLITEGVNDSEEKVIENFLVIDTKKEFTVEMFDDYHTFALLTENTLVHYDENKTLNVIDLSTIPDFTINADLINTWIGKFMDFSYSIPVVALPLVAFFAAFFVSLFKLVYMLFWALLIWPLAGAIGRKIEYGEAYRVGLHAMTLPILLMPVLSYILGFSFPFDFTVFTLIMVIINWRKIAPNTVEATSSATRDAAMEIPEIRNAVST